MNTIQEKQWKPLSERGKNALIKRKTNFGWKCYDQSSTTTTQLDSYTMRAENNGDIKITRDTETETNYCVYATRNPDDFINFHEIRTVEKKYATVRFFRIVFMLACCLFVYYFLMFLLDGKEITDLEFGILSILLAIGSAFFVPLVIMERKLFRLGEQITNENRKK